LGEGGGVEELVKGVRAAVVAVGEDAKSN